MPPWRPVVTTYVTCSAIVDTVVTTPCYCQSIPPTVRARLAHCAMLFFGSCARLADRPVSIKVKQKKREEIRRSLRHTVSSKQRPITSSANHWPVKPYGDLQLRLVNTSCYFTFAGLLPLLLLACCLDFYSLAFAIFTWIR